MSEKIDQLVQDAINCYNQQDWTKAQKAFEEVLTEDPENQEAYAFLGSILYNLGNTQDALTKFQKVENGDPPRDYISREWGIVLNDWGRALGDIQAYEQAAQMFTKAATYDPFNTSLYHHNVGWAIERQEQNPNRYEEAAKQYEAAVNIDDTYMDAWNDWGRMLHKLKKYNEAIEKFQKAIAINPGDKYTYYNWGLSLEEDEQNPNRYEEAAKQYEAAVKIDEIDPYGWNAWGLMLLKLEKYDDAIAKFRKATEVDPQYKYGYYNWGVTLEGQKDNPNRYEEAAKQYEAAVNIDDTYMDAWNDWGRMLHKLKKYDEAIEKFKRATEIDPQYKYAYRNWGLALEDQEENPNRYEEAAKQYEAAVNIDDTYMDAWNDWGRMLLGLRQYDEAIAKFKKSIEIDPKYKYAYYNWGWALERQKRYKEAINQYKKAIQADGKYVDSYNSLGFVLMDTGQYSLAEQQFRKIIEIDSKASSGYHNLAFLLERQGKYKKALDMWAKALNAYQAIPIADRTPSDWDFLGQISLYYLQNYMAAKEYLAKGLEAFTESFELLSSTVALNLELREKYTYETPDALEPIASAHWEACDSYQKALRCLEEKLENEKTPDLYLKLGRLQVMMEEYSKAEAVLMAALQIDESLAEAYNLLGLIKTKRQDYKDAIQDFNAALKYMSDDFGIISNLAEAYLKAEQFEDAEKSYQRILTISPSHMDSLIGLGETYATMSDAAKEGSRAGDAEMMYTRAIQYYSKAIDYEENAKNKRHGEFNEASKRLKLSELNAVYYSRGYARVSLYDTQSRKSDLLLLQAQNDFRKVTKYPADENYHKAKRAMKKVMEKLNPASSQNVEQRTGPIVISILAFVLFVLSIVAFFKGRPEISSPGFTLTDESIQVLEASQLPEEALVNVEKLVGKEFITQDGLIAAVKLAVGDETFATYEKVLLSQPLQEPTELVWKPVEIGYLAFMAFGSLIFMVAGLYLQQISKFKFGSIEIEKSSVSQISSSSALGIRK